MPIDRDFWTKLATKHGLTTEQAAAIAGNDALMGELNEMALRRDDYKTLQSQTESEKQAAAQAKSEALAKYQENLRWYGQREADLRLLDDYKTRYGALTADQPTADKGTGFTQKELDDRLRTTQRENYQLNKQLIRASRDFEKKFNEDFPFDDLEAIAMKPENAGRDFKDIYSDYIAPKLEAKRTEDVEARIKSERDKAYADGLAKGRLREPTQTHPDEVSPLYGPKIKAEDRPDDVTLQRHFVETYDKVEQSHALPV